MEKISFLARFWQERYINNMKKQVKLLGLLLVGVAFLVSSCGQNNTAKIEGNCDTCKVVADSTLVADSVATDTTSN